MSLATEAMHETRLHFCHFPAVFLIIKAIIIRVYTSLPHVTFWAGLEERGLGTPKAIITSETIRLMNQCMCLNDDLRQVTIQDLSHAVAYLGCSFKIENGGM